MCKAIDVFTTTLLNYDDKRKSLLNGENVDVCCAENYSNNKKCNSLLPLTNTVHCIH